MYIDNLHNDFYNINIYKISSLSHVTCNLNKNETTNYKQNKNNKREKVKSNFSDVMKECEHKIDILK